MLEAAGHHLPRRREAVAGLTTREVEVLILLARGLSNRQIAQRLVITPAAVVPGDSRGGMMPRLGKDSAPNVQDAGPAVDRSGDLDDTTVSFVTIRQGHSLAPLLRGLPGDSCQCPHWDTCWPGR